jgi:tRNA dimethylallyltransferase
MILGETGAGKTALSELLGERLPIEVINCDVGQFYEPLTIGTAKPAWRQSPTTHHLFDVLNSPVDYSVADYRAAVATLIREIGERGHIPVLVGGSLFYAQSLFFPPGAGPTEDKLPENLEPLDAPALWQALRAIDPIRAAAISPFDIYRIRRALALWYTHGVLPSKHKPIYSSVVPDGQALVFFVTRERPELYAQIDQRTIQMMQAGWIEEVAGLHGSWHEFLMRKKLIGYPEIVQFLQSGHSDARELTRVIQQKTRNYAKRQGTFWRGLSRTLLSTRDNGVHIQEYNLTLSSVTLYIDHMVSLVNEQLNG